MNNEYYYAKRLSMYFKRIEINLLLKLAYKNSLPALLLNQSEENGFWQMIIVKEQPASKSKE